jgi:predicted  nucleic acid-binding Zn-ribbon protein
MSSSTKGDGNSFINNLLESHKEPTEDELNDLKTMVSDWFKYDDQIRKLQIAIKERKVHQKALQGKIEKFMFDYQYKDLNTQHGKIKANERKVKVPVKMTEIKEKILELKHLSGEELLNEIFNKENRPTILKKNIRRVIPTVNLQI